MNRASKPIESEPDEPRLVSGKHVILAVFCIGLLGALGGWAYHRHLQQRTLALWGPETAELILRAPRVEVWRLGPVEATAASGQTVEAGGVTRRMTKRADATRSPGMTHLRHALVNDSAFDWPGSDEACQPAWTHALRFEDGDRGATLVFDFDCAIVACVETGATGSIEPIAAGTREMLDEALGSRQRAVGRGQSVRGG